MDGSRNASSARVLRDNELEVVSGAIKRSMPNGKTDVIKAMGNTKTLADVTSIWDYLWP